MRLQGKVALITGAGSGIGRGTALTFAREGADVVVNDLNLEGAQAVVEEVKALGQSALAVRADVSDQGEVDGMVRQALKELGKVDILVNNAGYAHFVPFHRMDSRDWDRMFAVHVRGAFNCTRGLVGPMMERKWGRIIHISSIAAYGEEGSVHYSAAKAALIGFAKALAKEVAPHGITVNAIAPGIIKTPILKSVEMSKEKIDKVVNHFLQRTPLGRVGQPEDIAYACLYLASEEASFVTGQVISPNGGYYI